jgi:hypothetical protein
MNKKELETNVGRTITSNFCDGFFGREYNLSGAIIIAEGDEYLVARKQNGVVEFCNFQAYTWKRNANGDLSDGIENLQVMNELEKQKLIDSWCEEI